MRYWLNTNKALFATVHKIITDEIQEFYTNSTGVTDSREPKAGIVSMTQRFGSALNLNPHLHILVTDGVHYRPEDPLFRKAKGIDDQLVGGLLEVITTRIIGVLQEKGYLDKYGELVDNPLLDEFFQKSDAIHMATQASLSGRLLGSWPSVS